MSYPPLYADSVPWISSLLDSVAETPRLVCPFTCINCQLGCCLTKPHNGRPHVNGVGQGLPTQVCEASVTGEPCFFASTRKDIVR